MTKALSIKIFLIMFYICLILISIISTTCYTGIDLEIEKKDSITSPSFPIKIDTIETIYDDSIILDISSKIKLINKN